MGIIIVIATLLFGGCSFLLSIPLLFFGLATPASVGVTFDAPPLEVVAPTSIAMLPTSAPMILTPTPNLESQAPLCTITVRQPPEDAPTRIPHVGQTEGIIRDVHLAYCYNTDTIQVGELWHLRVRAVDMESPTYQLYIATIGGGMIVRYSPDDPSQFQIRSERRTPMLRSLIFIDVEDLDNGDTLFTFQATEHHSLQISAYAHGAVWFSDTGPIIRMTTPYEIFRLRIIN